MSEETKTSYEVTMNWEAECERLSMIIMRQEEIIHALTMASYHLSDAMVQVEKGIKL